jgi:ubiquitin carboxyl-terminal hydrolase 8
MKLMALILYPSYYSEMSQGGLVNMGLTCYANAVIQCIRNCDRIPWIFEQGKYDTLFKKDATGDRANKQDLTRAFAEVIQLLGQCKKGQSVKPGDFWKTLVKCIQGTGFDQFQYTAPHDSHEFFLCLLDLAHEGLSQEVDMNILRKPTSDKEMRAIQALEVWKREFTSKYSPLVDLFYGLMHVRVKCEHCSNTTHRWEIFTTLKASIPANVPKPTLSAMLEEELRPERIEGYDCDKCAVKRDATKLQSIWRTPQNLVVTIKRFSHDGRKIPVPVDIPGRFDFTPLISEESSEHKKHYSLKNVVDHHGGATGGHYTAQCLKDGKWILYDDSNVMEMPLQFGPSTYILFFERD